MTNFTRPALRITDTASTQLHARVNRRQIVSRITITWTLMASAAVALFVLGSPMAHSAGGSGIGLPVSAGNDPTAWVPFPNVTQPVTAAAKQQQSQRAECSSAEYKGKGTPDQLDRKADDNKCR
jgi:hypothetical protein